MKKILFLFLLLPLFNGCDKEDEKKIITKEFTFEFEDNTFDHYVMVMDVYGTLGFEAMIEKDIRVEVINRKMVFSVDFEKDPNWYDDKEEVRVQFRWFGNSSRARGTLFLFQPNNQSETKFISINDYKGYFFHAMEDNGLL